MGFCDCDFDTPRVSSVEYRRARKEHVCSLCRGKISAGERYRHDFQITAEGDSVNNKRCEDCGHFLREVARTLGEDCGEEPCFYFGLMEKTVEEALTSDMPYEDQERLVGMFNAYAGARGSRYRMTVQ